MMLLKGGPLSLLLHGFQVVTDHIVDCWHIIVYVVTPTSTVVVGKGSPLGCIDLVIRRRRVDVIIIILVSVLTGSGFASLCHFRRLAHGTVSFLVVNLVLGIELIRAMALVLGGIPPTVVSGIWPPVIGKWMVKVIDISVTSIVNFHTAIIKPVSVAMIWIS